MASGTIHTNYGDKKLSVNTRDIKFSGLETARLLSGPPPPGVLFVGGVTDKGGVSAKIALLFHLL